MAGRLGLLVEFFQKPRLALAVLRMLSLKNLDMLNKDTGSSQLQARIKGFALQATPIHPP